MESKHETATAHSIVPNSDEPAPSAAGSVPSTTLRSSSAASFVRLELGNDLRGYVEVEVFGVRLRGLLDSGSARTLVNDVGAEWMKDAGLEERPSRFAQTVAANCSHSDNVGEFTMPFKIGNSLRVIEVLHVPRLSSNLLLGIDFRRRFHLRPDFVQLKCEVGSVQLFNKNTHSESANSDSPSSESVLTSSQQAELEDMLREYKPMFESGTLGCAKGIYHHIDTGDAPPFKANYNSLNPMMMAEAHQELDAKMAAGHVEPSDSSYCSPLPRLKKKNGGTRWVEDFRILNLQLPKINGLLMNTRGATIISSLDIKDAYLQIPLDAASKPKTAFYVPGRGLSVH